MKPLRILCVGPYPPPFTGWSIAIREESELLAARGHDCRVLNIGANRRVPSADYLTVRNSFDLFVKLLQFALRGFVFRLHVNGDSLKGLVIVISSQLIQLLGFKRACLTFHAGAEQRFFPDRGNLFLKWLWAGVFNLSRFVVCNSEDIRRRILVYRNDPQAVVAIAAFSSRRMHFEPRLLEPDVARFLEQHQPRVFSYFAYRPEYRLDLLGPVLVRLLAEHPSLGVIAVDDRTHSDAGMRQQFLAQIHAAGATNRFRLLGNVDHDTFLTVLARCDLYVRSHMRDGVCSSVLEALALHVPVVASENGSRPDAVLTYDGDSGDALLARIHGAMKELPQLKAKLSRVMLGEDNVDLLVKTIEQRYA
jgi:glycosyltransferase involved in cell wall biosynthesis